MTYLVVSDYCFESPPMFLKSEWMPGTGSVWVWTDNITYAQEFACVQDAAVAVGKSTGSGSLRCLRIKQTDKTREEFSKQ